MDGSDFFRSGDLSVNRDLQIVNMFYDRVTDENKVRQLRLTKRPGLALTAYNLTKVANTDTIRGFFEDEDTNTFYWVVRDKVYSVAPDVGTTVRLVQTLATTTGKVGFCAYLKQNPRKRYIIFSTGTELFYDEPATVTCTAIVSNCPFPHQPDPLYINGYVMVIKTGTGDIYNSDFDDPATWTVDSFVSARLTAMLDFVYSKQRTT